MNKDRISWVIALLFLEFYSLNQNALIIFQFLTDNRMVFKIRPILHEPIKRRIMLGQSFTKITICFFQDGHSPLSLMSKHLHDLVCCHDIWEVTLYEYTFKYTRRGNYSSELLKTNFLIEL